MNKPKEFHVCGKIFTDEDLGEYFGSLYTEENADILNELFDMIKDTRTKLDIALKSMKEECAKFRFPDEDRPILWDAINQIEPKKCEKHGTRLINGYYCEICSVEKEQNDG